VGARAGLDRCREERIFCPHWDANGVTSGNFQQHLQENSMKVAEVNVRVIQYIHNAISINTNHVKGNKIYWPNGYIKNTYEPTVFAKYTLSGFYATAVSEASVTYSCRQQEGPNLEDPSELAHLSLDYFIPTNNQM